MWNPKIVSPESENMQEHWNAEFFGISYRDKVVLDLGAANGDSAEYFLFEGAKKVYAVDGDPNRCRKLAKNAKMFDGKLELVGCIFINDSELLERLILAYKPDIVKSDIEGAEQHLLNMQNEVWRAVPEYIFEFHENYGFISPAFLYYKCEKTGYSVVKDEQTKFNRLIYVRKNERI